MDEKGSPLELVACDPGLQEMYEEAGEEEPRFRAEAKALGGCA
jgi:hypothetical protein